MSNTDTKIGSNREDRKSDRKNRTVKSYQMCTKKIVAPVDTKMPHNLIMLTEKHIHEKLAIALLIVGEGKGGRGGG